MHGVFHCHSVGLWGTIVVLISQHRREEEWKMQLILAKRIFQGREIVEGSFSWWIKSNDSYVEARCFDVLMMLKDQVLLSFIQDKNPRKCMIKLISRIFRKKFPNWKNKRFDQRVLSFQIEIFSLVIDYQQLKMFITVTRNLNSKFIMCNWLPEGIFRK